LAETVRSTKTISPSLPGNSSAAATKIETTGRRDKWISGAVRRLPDGRGENGQAKFVDASTGRIVYAPDKDWADDVISEVADFPYGEHDDWTDTVSLGWVRRNGVVLRKAEWDEQEYERQVPQAGRRALRDREKLMASRWFDRIGPCVLCGDPSHGELLHRGESRWRGDGDCPRAHCEDCADAEIRRECQQIAERLPERK
jgi:hypothetical protein